MLQTCNYRILENASALASMCRLRNVLNVFPNAWDHIYIYIYVVGRVVALVLRTAQRSSAQPCT